MTTSGLRTTIVTAPTAEPVTVALVKSAGNIDVDVDDQLIELIFIPAARERAERFLRRALVQQTRRVVFDDFERRRADQALVLPIGPVQSIVSVSYLDTNGDTVELEASDYRLDAHNEPARLMPAIGETWPPTSLAYGAVTVDFVCGYPPSEDASQGSPSVLDPAGNVPPAIKAAILMDCVHLYEHRSTVSELTLSETPHGWDALLWPHRLVI